MNFLLHNKGQTLIEVLIAFATLAVIITSATLAVISSLTNAEFVKNQHLAQQYSQQGLEIIRSMRDDDYGSFLTLSNPENLPQPDRVIYYCMAAGCTSLTQTQGDCGPVITPCTQQNVDSFVRGISIDKTSSNACTGGQATEVTSSVAWIDGECPRGVYCHSVALTSCLSPVNIVPTP